MEVIPGFRMQIVYRYSLDAEGATHRGIAADTEPIEVEKTVTFFLARSLTEEVKLSQEHTGFHWGRFDEVATLLCHHDLRSVLVSADRFLQ